MKKLCLLFFVFASSFQLKAQLVEGDIAFLHANADAPADFSWLALVDIPAGTEIFFTEDGWNGTAFYPAITEAHILWTSPVGGVSAGTVVNVTESGANVFTCTHGTAVLASLATDTWSFSTAGDQVLAYIGTVENPTKFIAGITVDYNPATYNATTMWGSDGLSNITSSALPPGLTNGLNAIAVLNANPGYTTERDNNRYNCAVTTGTKLELLTAINDYTNWIGDNTTTYAPCAASFTVEPSVTLPVELTQFEGRAGVSVAQLSWKTAQELNSRRFDIEHSIDLRNWSVLGSVMAAGNSESTRTYSYAHDNPVKGNNYYRLVMVDLNGSRELSQVVRLSFAGGQPLKIYPISASNQLQVEWIDFDGPKAFVISDLSGRMVQKGMIKQSSERIQLLPQTPGIYFFQLAGMGAVKFLIQ